MVDSDIGAPERPIRLADQLVVLAEKVHPMPRTAAPRMSAVRYGEIQLSTPHDG